MNGDGLPTIKAVVAYAAELRRKAEQQMLADPYARPYYPTTAAARKLVQRMANQAVQALGPLATPEQVEDATARGPQLALQELARRALAAERRHSEEEEQARRALNRHRSRQKRAQRDREAERLGLTLGQRLDRALAALAAIPAPPGTGFDAKVTGGEPDSPIPMFPGDPAAPARAKAREAVRFAEDELEHARRRRVELEAA